MFLPQDPSVRNNKFEILFSFSSKFGNRMLSVREFIWSFNTLFTMGIEYTAWTWLAMFWLQAVLTGSVGAAIRKNRN